MTAPKMSEAQAKAALEAAQAVIAEADAKRADKAAKEAAKADEERLDRARRVLAEFDRVEAALDAVRKEATDARDQAIAGLDLANVLQREADVHAAVGASSAWRRLANDAGYLLVQRGAIEPHAMTERPERRERRVYLFGGTEDGQLGRAVTARGAALAEGVLVETLRRLDVLDLLDEA